MSFLKNLFGSSEGEAPKNGFWKMISSPEDLESAVKESFERKVLIFKHSTRCFISKTVLASFERQVSASDKDVAYYFLDLIAHRDLSNKIEEDFGVTHQSPQIIILENGKAIKNASHQSISLEIV